MLKILLLSLSRQYTVDGQYIPRLFIEPEVRHDKTSYTCYSNHKTYINIDNKLNSTYKAPKKLIYIQGGEVGASATPANHIVNKS